MTNYSKTINLPETKFSMKANLSEKETQWLEFWHKNKIYDKVKKKKIKKILSMFYMMVRLMQMVTFILVMP